MRGRCSSVLENPKTNVEVSLGSRETLLARLRVDHQGEHVLFLER